MVYTDQELVLHTAAAGGAGNAGVATHLFPAVLRWVNQNLRGVQRINMNPAGGAASKSVIADLGAQLGDPHSHGLANTARNARKAVPGPGIGSNAPGAAGNALNTWDTRLNVEHQHDLESLDAGVAGLEVSGDGMTLAGPVSPADIPAMQATRDFFANALAAAPAHPIITNAHPGAAHFQAAAALTDLVIAADPRAAARTLRMARLTSRSGATGMGGAPDAGYQINVSGPALAQILPGATQP